MTGKRKQRQALEHGWETSTANNQIRVGEVFGSHPIENIDLLDPFTLVAIAKEKYEAIHEALMVERMTVAQVRLHMKTINEHNKEEKKAAKQIGWRGEPRYLHFSIPDCAAAMDFEKNFSEVASAYREHTESADLPMPLYIEQVNRLIDENKTNIIEALVPGAMPQVEPVATVFDSVVAILPEVATASYESAMVFDPCGCASNQLAPLFLSDMERSYSPTNVKTCEPMSPLEIEAAGGDINEFVGMEVEVRTMGGKPKFTGILTKFDAKNYFVKVATEEGEQITDLRETWVS